MSRSTTADLKATTVPSSAVLSVTFYWTWTKAPVSHPEEWWGEEVW